MKPKIYKALIILLALAILVSTCVCAIGTVAAKEATYYVSAAAGETRDGTKDYPFLTVSEAIQYANGLDYAENDTVNLVILGTDQVKWGTTSPTYLYTLKISSETKGTSLNTAGATGNIVTLGGKTYFDNFNLLINDGNNSGQFSLRGNDLTTGSNFTNGSSRLWHLGDGGTSFTKDINVEFNNPLKAAIILGAANASTTTFEKDINITFNNETVSPSFLFGASNNKPVTYNGNINFNFKNAKGVGFGNRGSGTKNFGPNAAIQVINSTGVDTITADNSGFDSITNTVLSSDSTKTIADVSRWTITNNSGYKDAITFTETAGVYNIDKTLCAEATDSNGDVVAEAVLVNEDDQYKTLDLRGFGAGEYTVDIFTERKAATYFVSATGNDENTGKGETDTEAKLTIAGAIAQATADDLGAGDTVTVKVIGEVSWGPAENTAYPYDFNLVVTSDTTGAIVNIAHHRLSGNKNKFDNVKLNITGSSDLFFCYKNVTTTSSVTIGSRNWMIGNYGGTATVNNKVNLEFNSKTNMMVLGNTGGASTINKDINITYNYANSMPDLRLGVNNGDKYTTTYNANINLNLKNATGAIFRRRSSSGIAFGDNAAIQVINSTGNTVTFEESLSDYLKYSTTGTREGAALDIWNITNNSGYKDAITFTNTAGVYNIDKLVC